MLTAIMLTFIVASFVTLITVLMADPTTTLNIKGPLYLQAFIVAMPILYIFAQGVIVGMK